MSIKVLYEDNHIIAVEKPAGVLTQPSLHQASAGAAQGEDYSLMDMVKKYLKEKYKKPGEVFLGLVHRLDKPVQGIVLFGKTSKGASRLSEQFRNHTIQKTYYAIVLGKLKMQKGEVKEKINKISFFAEGFTKKSDEELLAEIKKATKTRTAELSWEVVREKPFDTAQGKRVYTLLKILPKTGRFHQIRVQLSSMGNPILGDTKYGFKTFGSKPGLNLNWDEKKSIGLIASEIEFKTATENKIINLKIDLPEEWNKFLSK
ncbi:MAG: RluA family pseudouridine synthase [Candidatus Gastranaerophilales bacterium]|nr:RluA family pseudouridine synthase [Candidatus Gastranaerophilales bacterium]